MFGRKKEKQKTIEYDPALQTPVIRCSICNGEKVGALKNRQTGELEEIMFIRTQEDLKQFQEMVHQTDIPKEY